MSETARTPVSVIGLGSMGAALAAAFLAAGHPTTVWNRTPAKAAPLVDAGAVHAADVRDAVAASPLAVTCLTTFADTRAALEPAGAALGGRALVTLNSGSPAEARATARWAAGRGARFLAGAVKNVPQAVGRADTLLYYGGDAAVFAEHRDTLAVLGGDTVHLGEQPDLAALYEMAVGGTLLPSLVAFFTGAAALRARGLSAASMVRFEAKWLEMIIDLLPEYARQIDGRDYTAPGATVNLFAAGAAMDEDFLREAAVDGSWTAPLHALVRRAADQGRGEHSLSSLVELLAAPEAAR